MGLPKYFIPVSQVDLSSGGEKPNGRRARALVIAISGVALLATVLRLLHSGSKSLWVDECASLAFAQQPWIAFWKTMWRGEANMLTYYLLLRGWLHLGNTEFIVRVLSVLPAVASIFVIYLLGRHLFSISVGLLSALLLAVNACHIAYSQEARAYSLLVLFCTLSILRLVIAVEHPTTGNWFLYALVTTAAVYTHFFAGLLMLAQWLSLSVSPLQFLDLKKFSKSVLSIVLSIVPALWFMLTKDVGQIDFIPNPGILEVYRLVLFLASYGGKVFGVLLAAVYLVCVGISLWVFSATWRRSGRSIQSWRLALVLSCLVTPVFLDVSISHLGKQIFYYRYLIICLPALILLAAFGFCCIRPRRLFAGGLAIVAALSLATVGRYYAKPKQDWRDATEYLALNTRSEDTVVFYPWHAQLPLKYYQQQLHFSADRLHIVAAQFYVLSAPPLGRSEVVWLLSCREDAYLRSFQNSLSAMYPYHHELRYDGGVVVEKYSNQELRDQKDQDSDPVVNSTARSTHFHSNGVPIS